MTFQDVLPGLRARGARDPEDGPFDDLDFYADLEAQFPARDLNAFEGAGFPDLANGIPDAIEFGPARTCAQASRGGFLGRGRRRPRGQRGPMAYDPGLLSPRRRRHARAGPRLPRAGRLRRSGATGSRSGPPSPDAYYNHRIDGYANDEDMPGLTPNDNAPLTAQGDADGDGYPEISSEWMALDKTAAGYRLRRGQRGLQFRRAHPQQPRRLARLRNLVHAYGRMFRQAAAHSRLAPRSISIIPGTEVTLVADPDSGYTFTAWSGSLAGSENPATIAMNGNKTIHAAFSADGDRKRRRRRR